MVHDIAKYQISTITHSRGNDKEMQVDLMSTLASSYLPPKPPV